MKQPVKLSQLVILSVIVATSHSFAQEFDKKAAVQEAKEITQAFAGELKQELQSAMKAGGPINALDVCNLQAMPITNKATENSGAMVSRVSLKNRNPANVPSDWQRSVLEEFDQRAANGEDLEKMASVNVIETTDGKHQLQFMKALPTGGVCLACHGQEIDGNIKAKLDELYPEDKATGYSLGEVRGAIVVVKDYAK